MGALQNFSAVCSISNNNNTSNNSSNRNNNKRGSSSRGTDASPAARGGSVQYSKPSTPGGTVVTTGGDVSTDPVAREAHQKLLEAGE